MGSSYGQKLMGSPWKTHGTVNPWNNHGEVIWAKTHGKLVESSFHEFSMENPWRIHMGKNSWVLHGKLMDCSCVNEFSKELRTEPCSYFMDNLKPMEGSMDSPWKIQGSFMDLL